MASIYHTAITVSNIQKARKFYETLFGLKLKFENERPEMGLKFAMLEDKNGQKLELLAFKKHKKIDPEHAEFEKIGIKHVAFVADPDGIPIELTEL